MPFIHRNPIRTLAVLLVALVMLGATAGAQEKTTLNVGYIPIMPMAQLFVMEGEGWTREAGLELKLTRFSSGPAMIQALASGGLDILYFGIGPALVSRSRGIDIQVVAANVVEQVALIGQGAFAEQMAEMPGAAGIRAFNQTAGRKVKIASLPKGSVPDTVLRYWLLKVAGVGLDEVQILGMGASQVQQALLTKSVDAASILEPILTITLERLPSARIIAWGGEMLPNQPGAVVAVKEQVIAEHPQAIAKLVELHVRATKLLNEDPQRAVPDIESFIGKGLISSELLAKALTSKASKFIADPHAIMEATAVMNAFQKEIGATQQETDLNTLFNTRFYDALQQ